LAPSILKYFELISLPVALGKAEKVMVRRSRAGLEADGSERLEKTRPE
jgi:hypothetical protein